MPIKRSGYMLNPFKLKDEKRFEGLQQKTFLKLRKDCHSSCDSRAIATDELVPD
jgi:hypothetical protein